MLDKLTYLRTYGDRLLIVFDKGEVRRFIVVIYNSEVHMLNRISLQYAPNANERKTNERFTRTIRKTHETNARYTNERTIRKTETNERTIHETNARYTKRTNDTRNERTMNDTRTNESLERNHILSNDKRSWFYRSTIYSSIVLLFE